MQITEDKLLDARGLLCPMPVVKAGKEIKSLEPGQVLEVLATDRGSVADMPAWAADTGNELLGRFANEVVLLFLLRRRRK